MRRAGATCHGTVWRAPRSERRRSSWRWASPAGGALSAPEGVGDSEALRPVVLKQIPMRAEPAAYGPR
ncbi:hypothetical protein ACWEPZ_02485 [Streptomyces sp. NPDC004288]